MLTFKSYLVETHGHHPAALVKRVKLRIRGGRIQRNKKVSGRPGYTIRGGHLVRMSASERLHRKRSARLAKVKRRGKQLRAMIKRKRTLQKRKAYTGK